MHVFKPSYLKIPEKAHPLVKQLFEKMIEQHASIRDISDKAGVREGTISSWRYANNCNLNTLEACINALGYKLVMVKKYKERD